MSWMRRGTKPIGCHKSLREMVEEARLQWLAHEAVTALDVKKLHKFLAVDNYVERTERRNYGKSGLVEITTCGTDISRVKLKVEVMKKIIVMMAED